VSRCDFEYKPLEEKETLLQHGTIETSDVELKHTCFADVSDRFSHNDGDMSRCLRDNEQKSFLDYQITKKYPQQEA
jgi:hypothetical protein